MPKGFIYARLAGRKLKQPSAANDQIVHAPEGDIEIREIPHLIGYDVTSDGVVLQRGVIVAQHITPEGYHRISIRNRRYSGNFTVHSLVAAAFLGPRPEGYHVDHIDFDKSNNRVSNLRYMDAVTNSMRRRDKLGIPS